MERFAGAIDWANIVVAIDGPVASGKSTVGRAAAQVLGLRFLDTGIMYRAITWLALRREIPITDALAIGQLAQDCRMEVEIAQQENSAITIDGHSLGDDLVSAVVDRSVSAVSAVSAVRVALVRQQRAIADTGGIVMVGRDIGSVVLPDAHVKIYIEASPEVRARRRLAQTQGTGSVADYQRVLADTRRRDQLDAARADSPLLVADGARIIDTDALDLGQSVAAVVAAVRASAGCASATTAWE